MPAGLGADDARSATYATKCRDSGELALRDRIRVPSVVIDDAVITVRLLDRPAGTPFARAPSLPLTRRFALRAGMLVDL